MKKTLPIFLHSFKILLPALLVVCCGLLTSSFTFPSGTQNTKVTVVNVYPNPATSFVNFEFEKNIDKSFVLQVYSFVGKKMVETPVMNNKIKVDLNNFTRGIYVYQLRNKSGETIIAGKFQVNK